MTPFRLLLAVLTISSAMAGPKNTLRSLTNDIYDVCQVSYSDPSYYTMTLQLSTRIDTTCSEDQLKDVGDTMEKALDQYTVNSTEQNGFIIPAIVMEDSSICQPDESVGSSSSARRNLAFSFVYRGGGRCRLCGGDDSDGRRILMSSEMESPDDSLSHEDEARRLAGSSCPIPAQSDDCLVGTSCCFMEKCQDGILLKTNSCQDIAEVLDGLDCSNPVTKAYPVREESYGESIELVVPTVNSGVCPLYDDRDTSDDRDRDDDRDTDDTTINVKADGTADPFAIRAKYTCYLFGSTDYSCGDAVPVIGPIPSPPTPSPTSFPTPFPTPGPTPKPTLTAGSSQVFLRSSTSGTLIAVDPTSLADSGGKVWVVDPKTGKKIAINSADIGAYAGPDGTVTVIDPATNRLYTVELTATVGVKDYTSYLGNIDCTAVDVPMSDKKLGGCDEYDICLDEKVWWRQKLEHRCEICNNPTVTADDKKEAQCQNGMIATDFPRDVDCLNPEETVSMLHSNGCDVCTLNFITEQEKKPYCDNYNICKDSAETNAALKYAAGCDICSDKSVSMNQKRLYGCKQYVMCYDETVPVETKIRGSCPICWNKSVSETDKVANGCQPKVSDGDIQRAAENWSQQQIRERASRTYALNTDENDAVSLTLDIISPKNPDGYEVMLKEYETGELVWVESDFLRGKYLKTIEVWVDRSKKYLLTVYSADEATATRRRANVGKANGLDPIDEFGSVTVWLGTNPDNENDVPIVFDDGSYGARRSHLVDIVSIADNPFVWYIPFVEKEVSGYLTTVVNVIYGDNRKKSCLFGTDPTISVVMVPASAEGMAKVCNGSPSVDSPST